MRPATRSGNAGFTLAELVVASTMMAIVMGAVYTAFSSAIRTWRGGEMNSQTYESARAVLGLLTRELQGIPKGAQYLFSGDRDSLTFITVTNSLAVKKGEERGPEVMWVRYRLDAGGSRNGRTLIREERPVEDPIPVQPPSGETLDMRRLKLGHTEKFELAAGIRELGFRYYWVPSVRRDPAQPPAPLPLLVEETNPDGRGLPQGVDILLVLNDPALPEATAAFTSAVTFRGPTSQLDPNGEIMRSWKEAHGF